MGAAALRGGSRAIRRAERFFQPAEPASHLGEETIGLAEAGAPGLGVQHQSLFERRRQGEKSRRAGELE